MKDVHLTLSCLYPLIPLKPGYSIHSFSHMIGSRLSRKIKINLSHEYRSPRINGPFAVCRYGRPYTLQIQHSPHTGRKKQAPNVS